MQGWKFRNPFARFLPPKSSKKKSADYKDLSENQTDQDDQPSHQAHIQPNDSDQPLQETHGLRIIGLNKIYTKHNFGCLRRKDMHAVKDLRLDVNDGELLSILGHNGAGRESKRIIV